MGKAREWLARTCSPEGDAWRSPTQQVRWDGDPKAAAVGLGKKSRGPHKGTEHTSQKKQAGLQERDNRGCQKGVWLGG